MSKFKVGVKVNYLLILKIWGKGNNTRVLCRCDCGKEKEFYMTNIRPKPNSRYTMSCGCKRREIVSKKNSTHGMGRTKFYKRWRSMFDRTSPKYICAKDYVGIKVCKRWNKFENFRSDMFEQYKDHVSKFGERQTTFDRINPFKGYSPKNCRWATFSVQRKNTKKEFLKNLGKKGLLKNY